MSPYSLLISSRNSLNSPLVDHVTCVPYCCVMALQILITVVSSDSSPGTFLTRIASLSQEHGVHRIEQEATWILNIVPAVIIE